MSTILATELFQARSNAAIATSKLLLENSGYKLRNAPVNTRLLFGNKIKEVAKSNYEAQQQRFLASSSANASQQQKPSYLALKLFNINATGREYGEREGVWGLGCPCVSGRRCCIDGV